MSIIFQLTSHPAFICSKPIDCCRVSSEAFDSYGTSPGFHSEIVHS